MSALQKLAQYKLILASGSPRRHEIFNGLKLHFEIRTKPTNEDFPLELRAEEIAEYLAVKKALAFEEDIKANELIITADTIVWIGETVLNKPADRAEAKAMLTTLSNNKHTVFTGVCLKTVNAEHVFSEGTQVHFNPLSADEIDYYLDHFKPFDKAGAYGIQEFIGYIGIKRIEGDFYNVMGFPIQRFWREVLQLP